ncbi:hypothetical protein F2Q68_00020284 [Brassica cretica]|uniref:Uncharacterized protein n=1 Tax=Brassica cretica TaxID=69181 RepID=A0A8S9FSQ3_BRACR|nr:hypothetical protein F2Q68_00020284 [Brassica cretica]
MMSSGNGARGLMKGRSFGNLRNSGMQLSSTDAASMRTKKKNFFHELKFEMNFLTTDIKKGKAMLVAQDQDPNKMLNGEGSQLAYRNLESTQHSDDDFGDWEPQTTTHYECLVASEVTLRGAVSTLPVTGNPKLHSIRDMVEQSHDREKLVGTPAWILFLDCTIVLDRERLLFGRSHRTIMRNPPCLILGGIYRVRHELHLRNNELFVSTRG